MDQYFRNRSIHELLSYPVNSSYSMIVLFLTVNRFIYFHYIFFFYLFIYNFSCGTSVKKVVQIS